MVWSGLAGVAGGRKVVLYKGLVFSIQLVSLCVVAHFGPWAQRPCMLNTDSVSTTPAAWRWAPRVRVFSPSNRYLFRTHAEHARALHAAGIVEVIPESGSRVGHVRLRCMAPVPTTANTRASLRQFASQPAVFLEILGYSAQRLATYSFRSGQMADRWSTLQVQKDCAAFDFHLSAAERRAREQRRCGAL